jgi:hypothetical protein
VSLHRRLRRLYATIERTFLEMTMRFMVMHKHDEYTEANVLPPPELMEKMGAYIGEHIQRGSFLGGEGLGASATRTRITFRDGQSTVKHGPYKGGNELPAAALMLTVKTREEAIGWAERYGKILGDGEVELGPVNEAWDLGLSAKPDDAPLRILMLQKADRASEAGDGLSSRQKADLTRLKTEMKKAGVLTLSQDLQPSSKSKRLVFTAHRLEVVDGPFAESKELIGGFAVLELASMDEAIHECTRYAEILGGTLEVDVRPLGDGDLA